MQINFGRELDLMKHQTPQGTPISFDNEAIIFLDAEAFEQARKKFVVGEEYALSISETGIGIR